MQYVKERPHRQPLYPALLAIAMKLGNDNRFMLGAVNIVVARPFDPFGLSIRDCAFPKPFRCRCKRLGSCCKSVHGPDNYGTTVD